MSRIDELKKQHKDLALSDLDLMKMAMPDQATKYVEVLAKLTKSKYKEITTAHDGEDNLRTSCLSALAGWGIDYNYLETLETPVLWMLWNRMETLLGQSNFKLFIKFANLNERGLIANNDVTSYKSFNEIEQAISLAEIKLIDKELEKQIIKIHEDDEWLLLKPLSLEASMKYGASTKWCTTSEGGKYFANYSKWGILIYCLNKKTGYKFASFKNLDRDRDNEFSFWNAADSRIDPLEVMEIPTEILAVIRKEVNTNSVPNTYYMDVAAKEKLNQYIEDNTLRFASTGTATIGNKLIYTSNSTGNLSIGTIVPSTQLSINGDIEVRDGSIRMTDNSGTERARLTANGLEFTPPSINEQIERRLFADLTSELDSSDRIAADAQQRLDDAMAEQLAAANERVAEKHLSLLDNIEIGTVDQQMIERMQRLAGIETREMRIRKTEAELEQLRAEISREEEIAAEIESQREALKGDICSSVYEAEQPVVHSKHNWINKLKSGYEKAKVYIRGSKMAKDTEQPVQTIQD